MKTSLLLLIVLTAPALGLCQNSTPATVKTETFPVPVVILDSMIFEIRKGRACDSLQLEQRKLIHQKDSILVAYSTVIRLQSDKIGLHESKLLSWESQYNQAKEAYSRETKALKRKVSVLKVSNVVLAVLVVVLIL